MRCAAGSAQVADIPLAEFIAGLPQSADSEVLMPAERTVARQFEGAEKEIAMLIVGSQRIEQLAGKARKAFEGGQSLEYLNPSWIGRLCVEHRSRSLRDFAAALVDDMLDQAKRVAVRKMRAGRDG